MVNDKPPFVDPALADWLARCFPDRCPSEAEGERQIWIAVGAQKVIKKLRAQITKQSDNILES